MEGPFQQVACSHTPGSDTWDLQIQVTYSGGVYVVDGALNQGRTWYLVTSAVAHDLDDGSGWVIAPLMTNTPVLYDPFSGAAMGRSLSPFSGVFPGC